MAGPASLEDQRVIAGYVEGDSTAVRTIDGWIEVALRRDYGSLAQEWDDLRQETRLRVYRNLSDGKFRADSGLRTYVHQITKNVCSDFFRHAQRDRERRNEARHHVHGTGTSADADHLARDLLNKILRGLAPDDCRLVYLVHVKHRSYAQLAKELGISEGAVRLRVCRCRQRILKRRSRLLRPRESRP